jgi:octaprenyl-diphosphate synthase
MQNLPTILEVQMLIAADMAALLGKITSLLRSKTPLVQEIGQYAFQSPGKQVRPMLVFLAAGSCGKITPKARRGAVLVTFLHQASLAHDDVVDGATHRRGKPSIHAAFGNKAAVLFGDYLLATTMQLATRYKDYDLLALLTESALAMSEGELLQLENAHTFSASEATYLEIIHKKTGHLFGTCLAAGAIAAGASTEQVTALRQAGEHIGIAFQLKDDLLDYGTKELGKPLGMDLKSGTPTLPLIHALQQSSAHERKEVLHLLAKTTKVPGGQKELLAFVRQSAGMHYTQEMVCQHQQKALRIFANMAESPYQKALVVLCQEATII